MPRATATSTAPGFVHEPGGPVPSLEQLVSTVRVAADPHIADQISAAVAAFRRPLRIQVTGRAGAGKTTLLRALALMAAEETEAIDQPGVPDPILDADLVVYVLAGALQAADRRVLETLNPETTMVVLNKADAVGSRWSDAVAAADQASHGLGMQVSPMAAELAMHTRAGTPGDDDLRTLRRHAGSGPELTLSAELFVDRSAGPDVAEREAVLQRWGLHGASCAVAALHGEPGMSAQQLLQVLHAASGIDPVHTGLHRRYEQLVALRGGMLVDELSRIAARAVPQGATAARARDLIEDYLAGDEALWIALLAGLAQPQVRHLAAGYPDPRPSDADDALIRAQRWRAVAAGDMPAAARRAAIRLHNGYMRLWERLSSAGL
ncbi:hypothetical protein [Nocardia vermiculata]|uniref:hypothetical protein n=1 Tax=Nocardia vermiculata TaxID=257274 RepID=UPI000A58AB48|nr:hypothetical protein [Nocardia vermiculata]